MSAQNTDTPKAMTAKEFSALFRSDPENERLYRESEIRLDLAEIMTEMRKKAGLSQQELAERVGRKQPFIARLEKGAYDKCQLSTLRTFALAMGHDLDPRKMFVAGTAAFYTGNSSCGDMELSISIQEDNSEKLASISLVAWERTAPVSSNAPSETLEVVAAVAA